MERSMKTKHDISYRLPFGGRLITIPRGTKVIPADNLPSDSEIKYWVEPWDGMQEDEESTHRNYGFGIGESEAEPADDMTLPRTLRRRKW